MKKLCAMLVIAIMLLAALPTAVMPACAAGPLKTQLTINAPGNVNSKQTFALTGKLVCGPSGTGVDDVKITVEKSTDGKKWTPLSTVLTGGGGYYTLPTSESTSGKYFYRASFAGSKVYTKVTSAKIGVIVDSTIATSLVISGPSTVMQGNFFNLYARLTDAAGIPISGQLVTISLWGVNVPIGAFQTVETDNDGYARIEWWANDVIPPAQYEATATFEGGSGYAPATSNAIPLEVKEIQLITPALDFNVGANSIVLGNPITFSGTLKDPDGIGLWGKDVFIERYNGATENWDVIATATTDGAGFYSASCTEPAVGTYNYRARFNWEYWYNFAISSVRSVVVTSNGGSIL